MAVGPLERRTRDPSGLAGATVPTETQKCAPSDVVDKTR